MGACLPSVSRPSMYIGARVRVDMHYSQVGTLYSEVTEGLHAYGVASHRHMPEIEQGLTEASGQEVKVQHQSCICPMGVRSA